MGFLDLWDIIGVSCKGMLIRLKLSLGYFNKTRFLGIRRLKSVHWVKAINDSSSGFGYAEFSSIVCG